METKPSIATSPGLHWSRENRLTRRKRCRKTGVIFLIALLLTPAFAILRPLPEAEAYSFILMKYEGRNRHPNMYFDKGTNAYSELRTYVSNGGYRFRHAMRAGSGTGTNDCETNVGWLPNGTYKPQQFMKTGGKSAVVRGNVWFLGSKQCSSGSKVRTELFIHSNGIEGTPWNGNYTSKGCIKVSQADRDRLMKALYQTNHSFDRLTLYVKS